jgi:hypothetical protein
MGVRSVSFVPAFLSVVLGVCAGQQPTITGSWHLNVEKSHWGSKTKPLSVVLFIEHKEPVLEYRGTITHSNEVTRDFAFQGAIDGKAYPTLGPQGPGSIVLKRVYRSTFESVFRSEDGLFRETTRTSVSGDGRVLTRRIRLETPEGRRIWTEVYERH